MFMWRIVSFNSLTYGKESLMYGAKKNELKTNQLLFMYSIETFIKRWRFETEQMKGRIKDDGEEFTRKKMY